ncbi:hypothetical protein BK129_15695 [Paenibacillus amylolyticus]|uniref:hypothetical protein n=1 Tax=Paenibacillus amylolyticus TaxID=1451 RepID=UPI00096DDF07|nr:hypothetical protein [Paenibacillus amylolyticus]OMF05422.1 hypothetical protein BK129_15695 [Paenibacillus amylolyticus]
MKRFFGIIFIIISCIAILFSLFELSEGTDVAIINAFVLFVTGIVLLVIGIKMCGRPKFHPKANQYSDHDASDEQYDEDKYHEEHEEVEEPQEPVSVICSGCGARVKVYPNLSAECEYCGTTMRIS